MSPEALGNQWREYQWRGILKALPWPGGIIIPEGLAQSGRAGEERCGSPARDMFILMGKGSPEQLDSLVCQKVCENMVFLMVKREICPLTGSKGQSTQTQT